MKVRVEAPADWDVLKIAQAVVGPDYILKAEPRGSEPRFDGHGPLKEMSARWQSAYKTHLEKMVEKIRAYVEARPNMAPKDVEALQKIIRDFHEAFIAGSMQGVIDESEVTRLAAEGVLPPDLGIDMIEDAYAYGRLLARPALATPAQVQAMSHVHFMAHKPTVMPKLTETEKHAVAWAKQSAAQHIRGLGNKVADDFTTTAIDADAAQRKKYMGVVREALAQNIARRESWRKLASDLGHQTKDWARDFRRIAVTEKQNAMQEGFARTLIEHEGDPKKIRVAKQPNPDACPDCVRVFLMAGPGSPPKVFSLAELQKNGTNVGRHRSAWKPVSGTVHPHCACELVHVPEGMKFNEEGVLIPTKLKRSDWLEDDLRKAIVGEPPKHLTYKYTTPESGIAVRVGDPMVRAEIDKVLAKTPPEIFHKTIGVTLITTDLPRVQNPFDDHDLAYWTGNEIRLMQTLPAGAIHRVLPHEIGHSLNVHLMHKLGGTDPVRKWHRKLWAISKQEGFVTDYAKKMPIENAAEVTMLYLYHRPHLMLRFPRQFAFLHRAYSDIWKRKAA